MRKILHTPKCLPTFTALSLSQWPILNGYTHAVYAHTGMCVWRNCGAECEHTHTRPMSCEWVSENDVRTHEWKKLTFTMKQLTAIKTRERTWLRRVGTNNKKTRKRTRNELRKKRVMYCVQIVKNIVAIRTRVFVHSLVQSSATTCCGIEFIYHMVANADTLSAHLFSLWCAAYTLKRKCNEQNWMESKIWKNEKKGKKQQ